ncbi:MAG: dTDP-4-dehydrorhamnose reductase [Flavobacteriales bacterium]
MDDANPIPFKRKVLVTGLGGQLANRLVSMSAAQVYSGLDVMGLSREDFDLTLEAQMERVFAALRPDVVLNAAAYTAVDRAEEERDLAFAVNATGTSNLARLCARHGCPLMHISTDYVFDGQSKAPYRPEDPPSPLGVYGESKLRGEELALTAWPSTRIVRVAWLYDAQGYNFMNTMLRLARAGNSLRVVSDQQGTPTNSATLAQLMLDFAVNPDWLPPGIHHFGHRGLTTWHGFATEIFKITGLRDVELAPCTTAEYPTPAARPAYSHLDPEPIHERWGKEPRTWQEELNRVLGAHFA